MYFVGEDLEAGSDFGRHNQTLPQFPKPICAFCELNADKFRGILTSSINWSLLAKTWSEREKMSLEEEDEDDGGESMTVERQELTRKQLEVQLHG